MNILHISYQWPNTIYSNSGIFVKHTLENLRDYTEHNYHLLISNKIINKDYVKEKKFNFKNYIRFLFNNDFYDAPKDIKILRKLYFPVLGISKAAAYNAFISWNFGKYSIMRFVKRNKIELIHAHFSNPDAYIALQIKKRMGIPYVMHLHGRDVQEYDRMTSKEKWIVQEVYKNADHIICNSSKSQRLLKEITGIHENTSIVAFGSSMATEERKNNDLHDPIRILTVGNLVEIKGVQYMIDALKDLTEKYNIVYSVIGDGPMMGKLKQQVTSSNLDKIIEFRGRQKHEDVIKAMSQSDIFILPSYNEAFGIVYLEAMACGCSVVGVRTQGCEDINSGEECIYLTEPQNKDSIVKTIVEVIEDGEKRKKLKLASHNVLHEKYSWKAISNQIDNVYRKINILDNE